MRDEDVQNRRSILRIRLAELGESMGLAELGGSARNVLIREGPLKGGPFAFPMGRTV
jgi:hypothetical protein